MKYKGCFVILIHFIFSVNLPGQVNTPYNFINISSDEGLSQNSVSHILQDRQGIIWVATQTGVDKCVGDNILQVKAFKKQLTEQVTGLFDWDDNSILVATNINNYLIDKWNIEKVELLITKDTILNIKYISKIGNDSFIVFTDKAVFIANKSLNYTSKKLDIGKDTIVNQIIEIDKQTWILATSVGLWFYHLSENTLSPLGLPMDVNISAITFNKSSGIIYCGTNKGDIYVVDPVKGTWYPSQTITFQPTDLPISPITSLLTRNDSLIWVGTKSSGLFIHNINKAGKVKPDYFFNSRHSKYAPERFSSNEIKTIFTSADGVVWIGTEAGGLNRWQNKKQMFQHALVTENYHNRMSSVLFNRGLLYNNNIWSILPLDKDVILVGTNGNEIAKVNYIKDKVLQEFHSSDTDPKSRNIYCLQKTEKDIIIGTGNGLYNLPLPSKTNEYTLIEGLPHDLSGKQVSVLTFDAKNQKWLVGRKGISQIHTFNNVFKNYLPVKIDPDKGGLSFIKIVKAGTLVGTTKGFYLLDYATNTLTTLGLQGAIPAIHFTCALQQGNSDTLWLGTDRKGLYCYRMSDFQMIAKDDEKNGLPAEVIYDLQMDKFGTIWFSTNHGVLPPDTRYQK